jgi:16S rRNA (adenine1518-N6/adenine1519-N6)-dimethyltransferase
MNKKVVPGTSLFYPRKHLGQHFLIDKNAAEKIVRIADVSPADVILEIGPGRGELTRILARKSQKVIAIEIDPTLAAGLREETDPLGNVVVVDGDALKVDLGEVFRLSGLKMKVVANLPYQISTPLLARFLTLRHLFSSLVLMVQREVAMRIVAKPRTKDYGSLSVFLQAYTEPSVEMTLPPNCFFPRPKVDSAVVRFTVLENPRIAIPNESAFRRVVWASFSHRRKTLRNALQPLLGAPAKIEIEDILKALQIDPKRRGETLGLEEFSRLTLGLIPYLPECPDTTPGAGHSR